MECLSIALFDFNLHIPANALLFFVAAHLATARIQSDSAGMPARKISPPEISKTVVSLCGTNCIMSRGQVGQWSKLNLVSRQFLLPWMTVGAMLFMAPSLRSQEVTVAGTPQQTNERIKELTSNSKAY